MCEGGCGGKVPEKRKDKSNIYDIDNIVSYFWYRMMIDDDFRPCCRSYSSIPAVMSDVIEEGEVQRVRLALQLFSAHITNRDGARRHGLQGVSS